MGRISMAVVVAAFMAVIITIATQPVSSVGVPDINRAAKADRLDVRGADNRPGQHGSPSTPRQRLYRPVRPQPPSNGVMVSNDPIAGVRVAG